MSKSNTVGMFLLGNNMIPLYKTKKFVLHNKPNPQAQLQYLYLMKAMPSDTNFCKKPKDFYIQNMSEIAFAFKAITISALASL